jgi:hypothetical protein
MVKNIKLLIIAIGSFVYVQGQDSTKTAAPAPKADSVVPSPATSFSGSLDLYYRYNFANAPSFNNNYTSFTNSQNSFELGMATIRADHSWSKGGVTVELGFGKRAQDFSYNDGVTNTSNPYFSLSNIVQAFVYYNISDKIKLTAGKWGTHIGYEVVDAALNRNYSMSYMFSYGPFFNTGLKADIAIAGKTAAMVGISNSTDHSYQPSGAYQSFIAQLSTATPDSKWKFFLNYQGGKIAPGTTLNQYDLVATGTITDKFGVGFNATDQTISTTGSPSASFWGAAVYLNADPSPTFGLTLRAEYFSDKDSSISINVLPPGSYTEFTLTGQIHLGKLTVMPELRLDNSSGNGIYAEGAFLKNSSSGEIQTKSTFTGLIAATYVF